jgi:hypothetical protein
MALKNIKVPCYDSSGECKIKSLTVNKFAGRMCLKTEDLERKFEINIEINFDDLERAWRAVK